MPRARRHSSTPDQEAARVFEAKLKRHVQENPECQWEYDWFRGSLKKSIRRSRIQIDEQVRKKAESGQPLCDKFMQELAAPVSYLQGAQSPRSSLFSSHSPDARTLTSDSSPERDLPRGAHSIAGDASPERHTPFGLATTLGGTSGPSAHQPTPSSQTTVPGGLIPVAASNAQSPEGNPKFNPRTAIPGTPYDESAVSSVAPTPKVPGAFLASAHSLIPDSSVEHSPATRPDVIPAPTSEPPESNSGPVVPEIMFVPEPDMDTQTPRFEYPSPFDNHPREIPRVQPTTPHTSSEANDQPMVLDSGDRSDTRVGDHQRAGDVPVAQEAGNGPVAREAENNPSAQEAGDNPIVQAPGADPVAGVHPIAPALDNNPPTRESNPVSSGPYRLPGSYQASVHSLLTPGITPGASVDDLAAQLPKEDQASTPVVEQHPGLLPPGAEPALKRPDSPKSDAGLELDLFPQPPTLQVSAHPVATHSSETTPKSPISPIVPGAYNRSLFDLTSALPTRSLEGVSPSPGVGALPSGDLAPSATLAGGAEQAPLEPVPAPVPGAEPVPQVDVDQDPSTNIPMAFDTSSPGPVPEDPPAPALVPASEPGVHQAPLEIPTSTLQVHKEPDSSGLAPTPESAAPSPFALVPGFGDFDIRNRIVDAPVVEDDPEEPESQGIDVPLEPDAAPESNGSAWDPPESLVVVNEVDSAGEAKLDGEPLENVPPPVVLEPVVVPEDARLEEPAKTSADAPLADADSGIATSPKFDDEPTPEINTAAAERHAESPLAASEPAAQEVTVSATLQSGDVDKPQDEAQAPSQAKLEDLPSQEPEVRPSLDAPVGSGDIPPQARPKDEHVAPSSDPVPAVEQSAEPQQRHDNQPAEPAPVVSQPEQEVHDPHGPAPVEQESTGVVTDVQGPVLGEVSPRDVAVTPGPEGPPAARPEPTKEPEHAPPETKPEPLVKPEQSVPKLDQVPSLDSSQAEAQNIPVQQPEPQLELPTTQPADELLLNSERAAAPSQAVKLQLQETADGPGRSQPTAAGQDSSLAVPQSNPGLADPREAVPIVDTTLDATDKVPVQESTVVPPAPESTNTAQETTRQPESAAEPEQTAPTTRSEPPPNVQPSQTTPVPVAGESIPPPPAIDSIDLGSSPSPQLADATPAVHIMADAEPHPGAVQAPVEAGMTQEPPSPIPEAPRDLSSPVVGEAQEVVAGRDETPTADLSLAGRPDTQPNVALPSPGPVTVEIPGAPTANPESDDRPITPVSTSTAEVESVRTPQDTIAPQPRARSESPTPSDDPEPPLDSAAAQATQLSKEAGKLAQQFGVYGNVDDLDEAIEAYGQAAELLAPGSDVLDVSSYLDLGRMMRLKFEAFNDIEDLNSAFNNALLKAYDILRSTPTNKLYRDLLHELGAASLDRYLYHGSETAGDDAQRYCELALSTESSPSDPKRAETHIVLSRLHLARFENLSGAEDAVSALESLDTASKVDSALAGQARYMENRARALFACYQTRRPEYVGFLDEALALARPARDLTRKVTIQHPIVSTFLAELLLARYERSHDQPDLDEALNLLEDAVQEVPYVCPEQPWVGERLARALLARFSNERDLEDLDDAISFLEIALNLTVTNPYRRQARLDAFGGALTLKFRYLALGEELAEDDRRGLMVGIGSM
ncbi:hypothetical protein FRC06_008393 [Ceratobasidium sp. 370]|nr:hypothetical protein FRC06_008393 [Ceratobasidium sp. 370]